MYDARGPPVTRTPGAARLGVVTASASGWGWLGFGFARLRDGVRVGALSLGVGARGPGVRGSARRPRPGPPAADGPAPAPRDVSPGCPGRNESSTASLASSFAASAAALLAAAAASAAALTSWSSPNGFRLGSAPPRRRRPGPAPGAPGSPLPSPRAAHPAAGRTPLSAVPEDAPLLAPRSRTTVAEPNRAGGRACGGPGLWAEPGGLRVRHTKPATPARGQHRELVVPRAAEDPRCAPGDVPRAQLAGRWLCGERHTSHHCGHSAEAEQPEGRGMGRPLAGGPQMP